MFTSNEPVSDAIRDFITFSAGGQLVLHKQKKLFELNVFIGKSSPGMCSRSIQVPQATNFCLVVERDIGKKVN